MSNESPPSPPPSEPQGWPPWMKQWVMPYLEDSLLWPVAIALLAHLAFFFAILLVYGLRDGEPLALAGVGAFLVPSVGLIHFEFHHRGRPGAMAVSVVGTWVVAVIVAWVSKATGFM